MSEGNSCLKRGRPEHAVMVSRAVIRTVFGQAYPKTSHYRLFPSRWQARIAEMRGARQAYAKALHLRPDQGSLWGDAAAPFYLESQLRRAVAHSAEPREHPLSLRSSAERLIRGAERETVVQPTRPYAPLRHACSKPNDSQTLNSPVLNRLSTGAIVQIPFLHRAQVAALANHESCCSHSQRFPCGVLRTLGASVKYVRGSISVLVIHSETCPPPAQG